MAKKIVDPSKVGLRWKTITIGTKVRFKKKYWDIRHDRKITDETYIYCGKAPEDLMILEDPRGNRFTCIAMITLLLGVPDYRYFE